MLSIKLNNVLPPAVIFLSGEKFPQVLSDLKIKTVKAFHIEQYNISQTIYSLNEISI